jgi:hypothetical protein
VFANTVRARGQSFLGNAVVDRMLSLPIELREMKVLCRQALAEEFPGLFAIPTSAGGWNAPDWAREIRDHAGAIRELLDSPSRLDELIPPEAIVRLLETDWPQHPVVETI